MLGARVLLISARPLAGRLLSGAPAARAPAFRAAERFAMPLAGALALAGGLAGGSALCGGGTTALDERIGEFADKLAALDSPQAVFERFAEADEDSGAPVTNSAGQQVMSTSGFMRAVLASKFTPVASDDATEFACDYLGDADGRLTFVDFMFVLTLLNVPLEHFDVAFCLFDQDRNGTVDQDEFRAVMRAMAAQLAAAVAAGEGEGEGKAADIGESDNPRLLRRLFGPRGDKKLTFGDFVAFRQELATAVLRCEFDRYNPARASAADEKALAAANAEAAAARRVTSTQLGGGFSWRAEQAVRKPARKIDVGGQADTIALRDFAKTLVAGAAPGALPAFYARIGALRGGDARVTFHEFCAFHIALNNYASDLADAIAIRCSATGAFTQQDFARAARNVAGVQLSPVLVNALFTVFDEDGDGRLDHSELFAVLEERSKLCGAQPAAKGWNEFVACVGAAVRGSD